MEMSDAVGLAGLRAAMPFKLMGRFATASFGSIRQRPVARNYREYAEAHGFRCFGWRKINRINSVSIEIIEEICPRARAHNLKVVSLNPTPATKSSVNSKYDLVAKPRQRLWVGAQSRSVSSSENRATPGASALVVRDDLAVLLPGDRLADESGGELFVLLINIASEIGLTLVDPSGEVGEVHRQLRLDRHNGAIA